MNFYSKDIVNILESQKYSTDISFHAQPQLEKFRRYPSVEVNNISPQSLDERVDITKESNKFEIYLYYRYNRSMDVETQTIAEIEQVIVTAINNAVLADKKIILENKNWNRSEIAKVHGIKSTLFVTIVETTSTSGTGILGNDVEFSIGNISLNVLSLPEITDYVDFVNRFSDDGQKNIVGTTSHGSIFVEYESTQSNQDMIKNIIQSKQNVSATITVSDGSMIFFGMIISNKISAQYDGIKRAVLHMEI